MPTRPVRTFAVALLAALLGALLPATAVQAGTVQGGRLDWGIKSSFQSYVTGPVAKGGFKLKSGAATVGGSLFRFHSAAGSCDPDSGTFEASYSGGVSFQGHQKPDGVHELDMTISRPTVKISGGKGTLYVDVSSKAKDSGAVTDQSQVAFASLGVGGINMKGGAGPLSLTNIPATLTAEGAKAFAGYYGAGTQLDPVSLTADVKAAPVAAPAPSAPAAQPSATAQTPQAPGAFADAAVDWGCAAPSASTSPARSARAGGPSPRGPRTVARSSASRRAKARSTGRKARSTRPSPEPSGSPAPTSTSPSAG